MKVDELRKRYLDYFQKKGHKVFPSDTLVPDDPTVLFTSAGMNQFKPYFMGEKKDVKRATSCQKCLRTGDLENVGKTPCHHTFFEMLGNFSFGDYFKKEAIEFAWEFLTIELRMKTDDLWVSVFNDDAEAYGIWLNYIKVPAARIVKFGEKDNFWPSQAPTLGPNGPCGPCSEIYFDRGAKYGCGKSDCSPACDCRRFVEVWNLVFTQFNRVDVNKLEPLPQKNIDTGMGLERMAAVLQGKESNFEIDILQPLVDYVVGLVGMAAATPQSRSLIHAIVDHGRAATFCVGDGVYPSNEDRGYVVRKIIRKAVFFGHLLGVKEAFLFKLPAMVAELMKNPYTELTEKLETITKVIRSEEEKFLATIKDGEQQFSAIAGGLKASGAKAVPAADLFKLYDTYGFPLELSKEMAANQGLAIDAEGFDKLFKEQQERSRSASKFDGAVFAESSAISKKINTLASRFVGYDQCTVNSQISFLTLGVAEKDSLSSGEEGLLFLEETPFYAEGGGQMGDKGVILTASGEFVVEEVIKIDAMIAHQGRVVKGEIKKGETASACVDMLRRRAMMRAHTATHLLQAALREVLGSHVVQQGSLVDCDRLRFDFTHFTALNREQLKKVETIVNARILDSLPVGKDELSLDEAKAKGALAFFKDKYKDKVRMISIADFSKELCGGTHIDNTAEICRFFIESEASIASGVRRIEAVTGEQAYKTAQVFEETLEYLEEMLNCNAGNLLQTVGRLQTDLKEARQQLANLNKNAVAAKAKGLAASKESVNGVDILVQDLGSATKDELLHAWDTLRQGGTLVAFLLASANNIFICGASDDLAQKGISCKRFIVGYGPSLGIKGGGRDNLVQGVAQNADLEKIKAAIREFIIK